MKHRSACIAAAATFAAALVVSAVIVPTTARAATACKVTYGKAWDNGSGFGGNVTLQNLGDPWTNWTLKFSFAGNQQVTQGWSGNWTQSGKDVTVTNMSWNGTVPLNGTVGLGFNGSYSGANVDPASFTVNGVSCNGNPPSPTSSPTPSVSPTSSPPPNGPAPALRVSGNRIVTSSGAAYRLLGVNRSGGEFSCVQGKGMWDGPMDQASVTAIRSWKARAVRVPLNEQCWLGLFGSPSGSTYQQNVKDYVNLLIANGITPILEMHWSYGQYSGAGAGCPDVNATCQKPMPDAQYAPAFWTSVANTFKGNDAVVLDLFNEPFPDAAANWDATAAWRCWRDGGTCVGIGYQVAGFQSLIDTVRATGATNIVMVGGVRWANDMRGWLANRPVDPLNNLVAFAHIYNFNACITTSCWDSEWAPIAAQVPLTIGEVGQNDCARWFVDQVMDWADSKGVGYLGWTWNTWDCGQGPSLISNHDGTPTAFGQAIKDRLARVSS